MVRSVVVVVAMLFIWCLSFGQNTDWSIEGKALTMDNCNVGCPCILGEQPTHGRCEYSGVMVIDKGHYGDVNLAGVKWGLGGAFGRRASGSEQDYDFIAYYIDKAATAEQKNAMRSIFASEAFASMGKPKEIVEASISVTDIENFGMVGKTCSGTIGDILRVQITPVSGAISGKPIVVQNSAEPMFYWTAIGKASESYFKGAGMNWSFSGTSGESHMYRVGSSAASPGHEGHH